MNTWAEQTLSHCIRHQPKEGGAGEEGQGVPNCLSVHPSTQLFSQPSICSRNPGHLLDNVHYSKYWAYGNEEGSQDVSFQGIYERGTEDEVENRKVRQLQILE